MILDKVLLLKGLGGVAACAGLGCSGLYLINPDLFKTNDQILADLTSKVGLDCKTQSATGKECTKVTKEGSKIKVNQGGDNGKFEIDTLPASSGTSGKIKVYANNSDYNKGFKFVIEDADITLTNNNNKKLEQFETYEIKEDGDKKWYLTRKNTTLEEKRRILGLPVSDNDCVLPKENNVNKTCALDAEKLKKINFKDKNSNGASITEGGTVILTISKTTDTEFSTEGYKFSFNPTEEVTISSSNKIAKNSGTEFKITKEGNSLSLEKAWTVTSLAQKVGLTCPAEGSNNECTLPTDNALKLYVSDSEKTENGQVSDNSKKIKYEENAADHNQGFKFYAEEEITLSGENNSNKKIEQKGNSGPTYEIKEHTEGDTKKWYLTKKEAPAA